MVSVVVRVTVRVNPS